MAALVCDICGGKLLMGTGGIAVCDSCGMEHTKERMQEKVQEIKGTVRVDNSHMTDSWMKMGLAAAQAGNNKEAYDYFTKVIEIEPCNWRAVFEKGKAAAWQSTLANLRTAELYQGISMALEIISNSDMKETELTDIKNEFAVALFNINNAITDMMQNNLSERSDLYFDLNWDDMWETLQRAIQNTEQLEDAMSIIADLEDDLSKGNTIEFKKRICSDLCYACGHTSYWTDYSEEKLAYFGLLAKDKEPYINKWERLVNEIREYDPDFALSEYSMIDPFDPPKSYEYNRSDRIKKYWTDKQNKMKVDKEKALSEERFKKYWIDNADVKVALESERKSLFDQIAIFNAEINEITGKEEKQNIQERINKLNSEKSSLGIFKSKEKKAIQEQIDSLSSEIKVIESKMIAAKAEIVNKIKPLQNRINSINTELTMNR